MEICIRHVEDHDYEGISEIFSYDSVMEQTSQIPHRDAKFWKEFYASKGDGYVELVAVCEKKIAGHLGILLNQNPRRRHVGSFGIAVHPDFQGKGVGKALIQRLIDLADNWLNLLKIELAVFSDNEVAIALYKKFDFVVEGESRFDVFKQGKYCHSLKMARYHPQYIAGSQPDSPENGD